jgi:hypothetical protein
LRILIASMAAAIVCTVGSASLANAAGSTASVTLEWTAPGDDSLVGRATSYDLRYSIMPLSEVNFYNGTRVTSVAAPSPAGTTESYTVTGLNNGTNYFFAIKTADDKGNWSRISNVVMRTSQGPVAADDGVRTEVQFSAPFPNPSRSSASFAITVPQPSEVKIEAFDVAGRLVRTLASGMRPASDETLVWDLRDSFGHSLGAGLYLVRARIGSSSFTRRVTVSH